MSDLRPALDHVAHQSSRPSPPPPLQIDSGDPTASAPHPLSPCRLDILRSLILANGSTQSRGDPAPAYTASCSPLPAPHDPPTSLASPCHPPPPSSPNSPSPSTPLPLLPIPLPSSNQHLRAHPQSAPPSLPPPPTPRHSPYPPLSIPPPPPPSPPRPQPSPSPCSPRPFLPPPLPPPPFHSLPSPTPPLPPPYPLLFPFLPPLPPPPDGAHIDFAFHHLR